MINQNYKKIFSIVAILAVIFFTINSSTQHRTRNSSVLSNDSFSSEFVNDEIAPLCNELTFTNLDGLSQRDLQGIKIDLVEKEKWLENIFRIIRDNQDYFIKSDFKNNFKANISFNFNDFECNYLADIRISGDLQDHIRKDSSGLISQTSLNVKLIDGNIFGIVEFKLFLPETRSGINELIVTSITERFNILTPRTFLTSVEFNKNSAEKYIFQEKIVKEFIEYNNHREGPILQATDDFFWERRNQKDNNAIFLFPEITNIAWSRRSLVNQHISLHALQEYSSLFFRSSDIDNIGDATNTFLTYDSTDIDNFSLAEFDALMVALDSSHALGLINRIFFYDNISKQLLPIYYDGNSKISNRAYFKNAPIDICDESKEYNPFDYFAHSSRISYRYLCINDYSKIATKILDYIEFDQYDIYQDVLNKGGEIEIEVAEEVINNFKSNLNYLAIPKQKAESRNYSISESGEIFVNTTNYKTKFLFYDYLNEKGNICNQYLTVCDPLEKSDNYFSKEFRNEYPHIYPLGISLDSIITDETKTKNIEEKGFVSFGNPEIGIDKSSYQFNINFTNNTQKVLITNGNLFSGWKFNVGVSTKLEPAVDRMDINSLTGCLSFFDTNVQNISIYMEDMFCEDSLNLIRVKGTIDIINIENSVSDAVDIDFSNIAVNSINIMNAKNDCVDLSKSIIKIIEIVVKNCEDKALSIGERTELNLSKLEVSSASIGIAVKDSSNTTIDNIAIFSTDMCTAIYRKKQEFGPAKLITRNYYCEAIKDDFTQLGSEFINLEDNLND